MSLPGLNIYFIMQDKFLNKYRIRSLRLPEYDYSSEGAYFITICVKYKECILSEIIGENIVSSKLTQIVNDVWLDLPNHYPEILLDEYIIMPNHFHGIVMIIKKPVEPAERIHAERIHETSLQKRRNMLLPRILGRFKMRTSKLINLELGRTGKPFWQEGYFERIIRDEKELENIREYIYYNPLKWNFEKENPGNLDVTK